MIVDFHTHTFPDKVAERAIPQMEKAAEDNSVYGKFVKAKTPGTVAALEKSTKENGIFRSIVLPVATAPRQTESINLFAARSNENSEKTRLLSFGAIHPDNEDYREVLRGLKARGIKGIKLHPDYQNTFFDDKRYLRIMDFAANLDLIIVVHAGVDEGMPQVVHCTPDRVCNVDDALRYPKLVLAHLGGWNLWDEVEEKLVGRNFYLDTAVCFDPNLPHVEKEQFSRMVLNHGPGRILFGTDSPWADQGQCIAALKAMELLEEEEEAILGGNALRLLGEV